jgi:hypothetical protein
MQIRILEINCHTIGDGSMDRYNNKICEYGKTKKISHGGADLDFDVQATGHCEGLG